MRKFMLSWRVVAAAFLLFAGAAATSSFATPQSEFACEPIDGMPRFGVVPGELERARDRGVWRIDPGIVMWASACKPALHE